MMARTHLAFALLIYLLSLKFINTNNKIIFLIFVLIGSLLTDIDTPKSKFGKKIKPLSNILSFLFGHRRLFHSVWTPLILFIIYRYFFKSIIILALVIGYLSHLFIDGLTKQGINILHPIANLRIKGFIETGSFLETILFIIFIVLNILLISY